MGGEGMIWWDSGRRYVQIDHKLVTQFGLAHGFHPRRAQAQSAHRMLRHVPLFFVLPMTRTP